MFKIIKKGKLIKWSQSKLKKRILLGRFESWKYCYMYSVIKTFIKVSNVSVSKIIFNNDIK